ncbi:accessory Sec system glycosyltransferase Asp1 [Streptococcus agalactiae]|uniref:accessory Sec system glycosyltransferase Asp1 n=1 Tax=Streptococcus agalactiae TaxID=1311 RepID=UPI0022EA2D30|nr:accessory Sec system glycosyltransferase Asp1 [Streptococcus agalactiae]
MIDTVRDFILYLKLCNRTSSGIPQINTILTEFVEHRKNGYIIEEIQELEKAIPYYCEQLTNWNRSLIYSIDKINDYTGGQLVERIINSY